MVSIYILHKYSKWKSRRLLSGQKYVERKNVHFDFYHTTHNKNNINENNNKENQDKFICVSALAKQKYMTQ